MGPDCGVALVGFMGAGKTTVGRILADRLGWPFVDTDARLAARFGPVADQVRANEPLFRSREAELVETLCDGTHRVLATGGGTFVDAESRARLLTRYLTVYLRVPWAELRSRVGAGAASRPLWDDSVKTRFEARAPLYNEAAVQLDAGGMTPEAVADAIVSALRGR